MAPLEPLLSPRIRRIGSAVGFALVAVMVWMMLRAMGSSDVPAKIAWVLAGFACGTAGMTMIHLMRRCARPADPPGEHSSEGTHA